VTDSSAARLTSGKLRRFGATKRFD